MDTFLKSFFIVALSCIVFQNRVHIKKISVQLYEEHLKSFFKDPTWINKLREEDIFELAKINLTRAEENEEGFQEVSKILYDAFKGVGFAYVVELKDFNPDELLYWTKWFFNLPPDVKKTVTKSTWQPDNANTYRGLYPSIPGGHSHKEALETGLFDMEEPLRRKATLEDLVNTTKKDGKLYCRNILEEKNPWPITEDQKMDDGFRIFMQKNYKIYENGCLTIMRMLANTLGFERNFFDGLLFGPKHLSTHRLIHYPSRLGDPASIPKEAWDGDQAIVTGEHFDTGILTILATFENAGLQIKPNGYSKWIDVPARKDHLVINIGNLLADMVENRLVATNHRVVDIGISRYSVPFFLEPRYDGDLSKTIFGNKLKSVGEFTTFGRYMTNRTRMFAEYASIDWGYID
ncbi:isopenicillin N synthase-like [Clytia hemisphaerica]|uniref:Fe2OG dioxygenase domain-containing protein n=1 Tax=Clytia hemisphaerica TaxID=252671 RepID=A0A7M5US59_9CNID